MADPTKVRYEYQAAASHIRDGDTPVLIAEQIVRWPDGEVRTTHEFVVRILGVDTPETRDKDPQLRAIAYRAKEFTSDFLIDTEGILKPATLKLTGRKDVYGRWLGWVEVGGKDLSAALLEAGLGDERAITLHLAELAEEGVH